MRKHWISVVLFVCVSFTTTGCGAPPQPSQAPVQEAAARLSPLEQRIEDLTSINAALAAYHEANGSYPGSSGFQGYASNWGATLGEDWIPGLTQSMLPRDPSMSETPEAQYLYFSNGHDYKLIAHLTGDCGPAVEQRGVRIDPNRRDGSTCWAYGFWSLNGEGF